MKNKILELKNITFGPDLVGFGSADSFDKDDPIFKIMPEVKTVICLAYRILRGCHRGIEEGTSYHHYTTMAIENLEETIMPMMALRVCRIIEDEGYIAIPQKRTQTIMQEDEGTNPEMLYNTIYRGRKYENQMNFPESAVKCAIGELGFSGSLLTEEFGPLQRYCFILTDAPIEPDAIKDAHICDNCLECKKACPGGAIDDNGERDNWQCAAYYAGANMSKNPFMSPHALSDMDDRLDILNGKTKLDGEKAKKVINDIAFYPPIMHSYISSICGHACDRACYIHLEEKGVLTRKFNSRFRKREEWKLDVQ